MTNSVPDKEAQMKNAELTNGRAAMIGIVFAIATYLATGDIIPGLF